MFGDRGCLFHTLQLYLEWSKILGERKGTTISDILSEPTLRLQFWDVRDPAIMQFILTIDMVHKSLPTQHPPSSTTRPHDQWISIFHSVSKNEGAARRTSTFSSALPRPCSFWHLHSGTQHTRWPPVPVDLLYACMQAVCTNSWSAEPHRKKSSSNAALKRANTNYSSCFSASLSCSFIESTSFRSNAYTFISR